MASDAHCHPWDLLKRLPGAEEERWNLAAACAASAWSREEFEYHEGLARKARAEGGPALIPCFAVHPQLPAELERAASGTPLPPSTLKVSLSTLREFAEEGRLGAVGETGFDLYGEAFRRTEPVQDELFAAHLEIALSRGLPLVLHIRRAMHKVFAHTGALKKLPAVVFHSWPGTLPEGEALLRRGINAYFSFGTTILLNHKEARRSCASLPADRLLVETDAPYQPPRGKPFSSWADIPAILREAAALRREAGNSGGEAAELEALTDGNFHRIFGPATGC
jgi:TatD DNase family protein